MSAPAETYDFVPVHNHGDGGLDVVGVVNGDRTIAVTVRVENVEGVTQFTVVGLSRGAELGFNSGGHVESTVPSISFGKERVGKVLGERVGEATVRPPVRGPDRQLAAAALVSRAFRLLAMQAALADEMSIPFWPPHNAVGDQV